ncbi:MAG: hypothetical protein JXB62_03725, partial [Pirellulales bacterium]|nr:hypothetical protein [Pirellulales bacterium]
VDEAGNSTGFFLSATRHQPRPAVEIDQFDFTIGDLEIRMPNGAVEMISVTGPATVAVYFEGATEGTVDDDDGDGRDEVVTQMTDLDLVGLSPTLGPVRVTLNPMIPSLGEIEETANNTPGVLDLPPFAATGTADSFFDLFFQVDVAGETFHTTIPKRMSGQITEKPPGPLDWYEGVQDIPLLNGFGFETDFYLVATHHRPRPPVEIDQFDLSLGSVELVTPLGVEMVELSGPTTVAVYFEGAAEGTAYDNDGDQRDEVRTQIVDLNLTGHSPMLGPITVRLHPGIPSLGEIEETLNFTPGVLDLPPFADGGSADSFFDVFFEIEVGGQLFHTEVPKRMHTLITHKPPRPGDVYENLQQIPLINAYGFATGFSLGATHHQPRPFSEVVDRHVFYNNSAFDGSSLANPDATDNDAVAPDKEALLPGQTATFANYTSYGLGVNGVMIDLANLPVQTMGQQSLDPLANFEFRVGNDNNPSRWDSLPPDVVERIQVTVHPGEGVGNSDRLKLILPDYAVRKEWLQITVLATADTALSHNDVFYFGNAVADAGNSTTNAQVNATDMLLARNNPRTFLNPAAIDFPFDYNRDARVNATDMLLARNNQTHFLNALRLITVPATVDPTVDKALVLPPAEGSAARWEEGEATAAYQAVWEQAAADDSATAPAVSVKMDWLYEFERGTAQPQRKDKSPDQAVDELLRMLRP